VPSACTAASVASVASSLACDDHLVELLPEHVEAGGGETVGEALGARAQAVDQLGHAFAAERAQRCVDGDAARAAGELGCPVHGLARAAGILHDVGGGDRDRGAVRLAVPDEDDPAVERDVQPLVRVGRPGVGLLRAAHQVRAGGAGGGPQPERAVDVHPGAGVASGGADVHERIDGPAVHVAGLRDHDRLAAAGQRRGERLGPHRPLRVDSNRLDRRGPEAEQPQRAVDGHVALGGGEHADARRAHHAVALDVVARVGQDTVARRGQAGSRAPSGSR
jgi:hypothetical protein